MNRHLRGLHDVTDVTTVSVSRALFAMGNAADDNDLALIIGDPGTGKTHTALRFLDTIAATGRRTLYLPADTQALHTTMTTRLLHSLTGARPTGDGYFLVDELVEHLNDTNPVVVVDEAHRAQARGIEQLIDLKERADDWTLILIGSEMLNRLRTLPGVRSRAHTNTAQLLPLTGGELLVALKAWHPLFGSADPMHLQAVDDRYCHGNFRQWAALLRAALKVNARFRAEGRPAFSSFTGKLTGLAVAAAGFDTWEVPA